MIHFNQIVFMVLIWPANIRLLTALNFNKVIDGAVDSYIEHYHSAVDVNAKWFLKLCLYLQNTVYKYSTWHTHLKVKRVYFNDLISLRILLCLFSIYTLGQFLDNAKYGRWESCGIIKLLSSNDQGPCFVWIKQTGVSYTNKRAYHKEIFPLIQEEMKNIY